VRLDLVSDFIAPGLACVNPVFAVPAAPDPRAVPSIELSVPGQETSRAPATAPAKKKAQISLSDCLACSGCVTSAETVLLQMQSAQQFVSDCRLVASSSGAQRVVVVTLSPQSRASLAARLGISAAEAHQRIAHALKTRLGVSHVLNASTLAHEISQTQVAHEFVAKFRANQPLPLISSSCPGWVCYAEKSQPAVLPYLCTAKSAQQVAGVIVKQALARRLGLRASEIYHAAVMPCPDKKLESARGEFASDGARDVDLVLTSTELCDALLSTFDDNDGITLHDAVATGDADPSSGVEPKGEEYFTAEEPSAGGSGSYAAYCFRYAAHELFGVVVPPAPLPFRAGRNADSWSIELEVQGKTVLRFEVGVRFAQRADS